MLDRLLNSDNFSDALNDISEKILDTGMLKTATGDLLADMFIELTVEDDVAFLLVEISADDCDEIPASELQRMVEYIIPKVYQCLNDQPQVIIDIFNQHIDDIVIRLNDSEIYKEVL